MYAQSSLLLCNTSQSRWCVNLEQVRLMAIWSAERRFYPAGFECGRKGPATSKLEHLVGGWDKQQCRQLEGKSDLGAVVEVLSSEEIANRRSFVRRTIAD
jgi:hypothetical protein